MKRPAMVVLVAVFALGQTEAQWVQTALGDAQIGYNLFSDDSGVWAATLNGVYNTTDTGNPWFSWGLPQRLVFDVIKSGSYVLAATEGTGPGVFRTSDNGVNWLSATGIANQSVRAFTKNSSFVFACTWGGGVFRSSDHGETWQPLGFVNHPLRSMYTLGETVYAGGDSVFFSSDNGMNWTRRGLPYPAGDTRCFSYHNGKLYAGDVGLYVSPDLGLTWSLVYGVTFDSTGTPIDTKIFYDLASHNQTLIAAMSPGGITISRNNGTSWAGWNEGVMSDWTFAALAIRAPYIWSLRGFFGNAYIRPLSDLVTGVDAGGSVPVGYMLSQNYPNPFNPTTVVRYHLPVAGQVRLAVSDLLGREVSVLVDGRVGAGHHEVTFDASGLPAGVYFCRLQAGPDGGSAAGGYQQTRMLLLLR